MKYLIRKEINLFFSSSMGYVIVAVWLLAASLMLWVFAGEYNIADRGYATLRPFFSLAPVLFLFLIPAVTMKLFAEEKRMGTLELLFFRPVGTLKIVFAKYISACLLMFIALLPTLLYVVSICLMSNNGMDAGEVTGGYLGMMFLIIALVSIGIFSSSVTSNQLVAFLLAVFLSFIGFYGFDLLASLFTGGNIHNFISGLGMNAHYSSMIRGMVDSHDIIYFLSIAVWFLLFSEWVLVRHRDKRLYWRGVIVFVILIIVQIIQPKAFIRIDLTEGKRYSLSPQSRQLVSDLDKPLQVVLYLNGNLNPSFDRLRAASVDVLEELSQYSGTGIIFREINPSAASDEKMRQNNYLRMDSRGMRGVSVNEHDREGKLSSKVVFPWMELIYDGDTVPVSLLSRNTDLSPQEVLNISVGDLEYGLTEGIRLLTMKEASRIAFIEGHGEFPEPYVYEATELLSKYYTIDRGAISGDPQELYPYKVLIIASPHSFFSEAEKFALDQYVMNGGSILFFLDGTQISQQEFDLSGESATLKKDINLDDLLFTYGIRINPVTVQDMNCTPIRVASSETGSKDAYAILPWYFAPLLQPSGSHVVSRNLSPLKSEMVSTISFVGKADSLRKTVLLTTSANAHILPVPDKVSLRYVEMPADPSYFNEFQLPVAAIIEGSFPSAFRNRLLPPGAREPESGRMQQGKPARLIVAASGSLIKNEWKGQGAQSQPLPLGFDVITGEQLGNSGFLVNAVNYLAGNGRWLNLRSRDFQLHLLNKQEITTGLLKWQIFNVAAPLVLLFVIGGGYVLYRRRKYS